MCTSFKVLKKYRLLLVIGEKFHFWICKNYLLPLTKSSNYTLNCPSKSPLENCKKRRLPRFWPFFWYLGSLFSSKEIFSLSFPFWILIKKSQAGFLIILGNYLRELCLYSATLSATFEENLIFNYFWETQSISNKDNIKPSK